MSLRTPAEIEINGRSLADIVSRHEEWVGSGFRSGERAVLEGADLREVNLAGVDLRQADLTNADLRGADLGRSRLNDATLRGALLRDAVLNGVDFTDDTDTVKASTPILGSAPTDLEDVDMGGADLTAARLPAFLPQGSPLSGHPPLWPFGFWIAGRMPLLVEASESRWDKLRGWATAFLLWWFTPLILLAIWWRYLVLHKAMGTFVHVAVTAAALAIAGSWRSTALRAFRSRDDEHHRTRPVLGACIGVLALACVSYATLELELSKSLSRGLEVRFEDFSSPEPLSLRGRNLRFASLAYCALHEADLSETRLERASLAVSDLTSANLRNSDLRGATLFSTRLQNVQLNGANLAGANLRCASGLTDRQLATAITDKSTIFPDGSQGPLQPGSNVTHIDPLDCAHWRPDGTQVPPEMIERLRRLRQGLPEIDLGPIPELGPPAASGTSDEEPTTEPPDANED